MNLNPRQLFTLNEMGIPVWELRSDLILNAHDADVDKLVVDCGDLLTKITACRLIVLTTTSITNDQEKRLLHAIVFSLGLTVTDLFLITKDEFKAIEDSLGDSVQKPVLILGNDLAGNLIKDNPAEHIMISCSLSELLVQTDYKTKVWENLKSFKSKLSSLGR